MMEHPMTILQAPIIELVGNAIIADTNGKHPYSREQEGINVQNVTNNLVFL